MQLLFWLYTSMREDNFSLETAILATNLKLLRFDLIDLKFRILSSNQLNSVCKLRLIRHSSRCQNGKFGRIVGKNIKQFPSRFRISILTKSSRLINKQYNILSIKNTNINRLFSILFLMIQYLKFLLIIIMMIKHLICTMQIRNYQVHNLLIPTWPTVNHSRIEITILLDRTLHSSEGELLLLVIRVTTHLHSHWTDQARIKHLHLGILLVH